MKARTQPCSQAPGFQRPCKLASHPVHLLLLDPTAATFCTLQAHNINIGRHESSITKIGRFLDGTLTKLLWGSEASGQGNSGAGTCGGWAATCFWCSWGGHWLGRQALVGAHAWASSPSLG